jgi:hypothetical protein
MEQGVKKDETGNLRPEWKLKTKKRNDQETKKLKGEG